MKLHVKNLDTEVTAEALKAAFGAFGTVKSARILLDKDTQRSRQRSRGAAIVEMDVLAEASAAVEALDDKPFGSKGKKMTVGEDKPQDSRSAGNGSGSGGGGGGYRGGPTTGAGGAAKRAGGARGR